MVKQIPSDKVHWIVANIDAVTFGVLLGLVNGIVEKSFKKMLLGILAGIIAASIGLWIWNVRPDNFLVYSIPPMGLLVGLTDIFLEKKLIKSLISSMLGGLASTAFLMIVIIIGMFSWHPVTASKALIIGMSVSMALIILGIELGKWVYEMLIRAINE